MPLLTAIALSRWLICSTFSKTTLLFMHLKYLTQVVADYNNSRVKAWGVEHGHGRGRSHQDLFPASKVGAQLSARHRGDRFQTADAAGPFPSLGRIKDIHACETIPLC
jgi:hypothetical protein